MTCQCGYDNTPDSRFCGGCGSALASDALSAPASRTRTPAPLIVILAVAVIAALAGGFWWWKQRSPARRIDQNTSGLYLITIDGKSGFIDRSGKVAIAPQFDVASDFADGLAAVKFGQRYGYIDEHGTIVINPQFDMARDFFDGVAPVSVEGHWGYIDKTGKYLVNPQFDSAYRFAEGLGPVKSGNVTGYVDKTGRLAINPQFDLATSFSEQLAAIRQGQLWGFIDHTGKIVINPQFNRVSLFHDGLAAVAPPEGKLGYIDKTGKFVINPQFDRAGDFIDGMASVVVGEKLGFIDKAGHYVVNPQYDAASSSVSDFAEGLAAVTLRGLTGYIDKTGKTVIEPKFEWASGFRDGIAHIRNGARTTYIKADGSVLWQEPTDDSAAARRTMADIRSIATAWDARATDMNSYASAAQQFIEPPDVVSDSDLESRLEPTYIRSIPKHDGWGNSYHFASGPSGQRYEIRSNGRDGRPQGTPYRVGPTTNFDCDIIYSMGTFVQYPEGMLGQQY